MEGEFLNVFLDRNKYYTQKKSSFSLLLINSVISGALMVGGLYNVLWGKRIEQVALSKQGGSGENGSCFDLEEQESGAPVPATRDSIKPVPGSKERTDPSS